MKPSEPQILFRPLLSAALCLTLMASLASCNKEESQVAALNEFFASQIAEREDELRQERVKGEELRSQLVGLTEKLKALENENEALKAKPPLDPEELVSTLTKSVEQVINKAMKGLVKESEVKSEVESEVAAGTEDRSNHFNFPRSQSPQNAPSSVSPSASPSASPGGGSQQGGRTSNPNAQKFDFSFP